jgi:hypothetical protein
VASDGLSDALGFKLHHDPGPVSGDTDVTEVEGLSPYESGRVGERQQTFPLDVQGGRRGDHESHDQREGGETEGQHERRPALATTDAEVAACSAEGGQSELTSGDWRGVFGPTSQGGEDDERWTWWLAVNDRWALVQASPLNEATDADLAEFEDALETVLADQQERLERD